ncbi:MAG: isoprenyl transferase [Planctomycetes bacterium]|nr:isoprenyl transferase [Planctomycetota bacterium]
MAKPVPKHIAIIMDGNGRWAEARGMRRVKGHEAGIDSVRAISEECARLGVGQLTLYAFSEENWRRPRLEIEFLMRMLKRFLVKERDTLMRNNMRFGAVGRLDRLPKDVRRELDKTIKLAEDNTGTLLSLALSYGGRAELVDAMKNLAERVQAGELQPDQINEAMISANLYQPDMPDPDLVIRTAGEMRLSNFLLWQISYAELYVTETLWPDFREEHLQAAIEDFTTRERRFGGLVDRPKSQSAAG